MSAHASCLPEPGGFADGHKARHGRHPCITAEPSGELPKGDIMAVGGVALAVASVGWFPVTSPLTEVRTREHGTRPLPAGSRLPDIAERPPGPCPGQGANW